MIQINSRELDEIIKNFDKKLAEYEQNIHVLDYEMKAIKDNWQSNRANLLYTVVDENQNKSKRLIENMKEQQAIYQNINSQYQKISNKIYVNIDAKESILKKLDNIILKLTQIINRYDNLNIYFYNRGYKLLNQKEQLLKNREILKKIKVTIQNRYSEIEKIEEETMKATSRVEIVPIQLESYQDRGE